MPTIVPYPPDPQPIEDEPQVEAIPLNAWDSFDPIELGKSDGQGHPHLWLFGDRNVGNFVRTNITCSGMLRGDEQNVVTNWYARTNILTPPAEFHAFASSTIVFLEVGSHRAYEAPLSDLLQRKSGDPWPANESAETAEALAENMYVAAFDPAHSQNQFWHQMLPAQKRTWRRIAATAHGMVTPPILAFIPERQTYSVQVVTERRALSALLEVLPTNVAPESLIWIHLEGTRRHVVNR